MLQAQRKKPFYTYLPSIRNTRGKLINKEISMGGGGFFVKMAINIILVYYLVILDGFVRKCIVLHALL